MANPALIPTWLDLSNADHAADAIVVADAVVGYLRTVLADDVLVAHHLSLPEPGIHRVYESETWDILEIWSDVQTLLNAAYGSFAISAPSNHEIAVRRVRPDGKLTIRSYTFSQGGAPCAKLTVSGDKARGRSPLGLVATVTNMITDSARFMYAPVKDDRSSDQLANHALLRAMAEILATNTERSGSAPEGVCTVQTEFGEADVAYRCAGAPHTRTGAVQDQSA